MEKELYAIKCPSSVAIRGENKFTLPARFHRKFLINVRHWITWACKFDNPNIPVSYVTAEGAAVGSFVTNMREKWKNNALAKQYADFLDKHLKYKMMLSKKTKI